MKSARFSKVVAKCGKPEVYLLMTETDPDFHKAVEAGKIMSLSSESHGSGTDYGTVGYDKKRHGQLLLFPKSLKPFADAKIIGIKYDLFNEDKSDEKKAPLKRKKETKKAKPKGPKSRASAKPAATKARKNDPKSGAKKLIPFPAKKAEQDDDEDDELKGYVRQAMRALEKGNSVAAYNILKRIIPDT